MVRFLTWHAFLRDTWCAAMTTRGGLWTWRAALRCCTKRAIRAHATRSHSTAMDRFIPQMLSCSNHDVHRAACHHGRARRCCTRVGLAHWKERPCVAGASQAGAGCRHGAQRVHAIPHCNTHLLKLMSTDITFSRAATTTQYGCGTCASKSVSTRCRPTTTS